MSAPHKERLEAIFRAAVAAADPERLAARALRADARHIVLSCGGAADSVRCSDVDRIYLVGGGKAGRAMGEAALRALDRMPISGALAVPRGAGGNGAGPVRFLEAGHPLPDEGSLAAAREMLRLLEGAGPRDVVIALISGGGSAMISAPPDGVPSGDKAETCRLLLRAGADIASFNAVRKHLSRVKGGRMAQAAWPARCWALLLSDVPGDDPSVIASGPFSPDPSTYADALDVLSRLDVLDRAPPSVRRHLQAGVDGTVPETPKPGAAVFERIRWGLAGSNGTALEGACAAASKAGVHFVRVLPGFLRGEARECARRFVSEVRAAAAAAPRDDAVVVLAGGETTVRVRGTGKGGRNQEFALAAALELDGSRGISVLAGGTDGIDGPTNAAGAVADGSSCARAQASGLENPCRFLENNDAYSFFAALGDLVLTGPTGTNVADLAIAFVAPGR